MTKKKTVIIGGGPAGLMAAISAANVGSSVTLIEKNRSLGKKLLLTGNRRCNFANTADIDIFISKFGKNGRFLRNAWTSLAASDIVEFFETRGLRCKVESSGRIFPLDDRSSSVLEILEKELKTLHVQILKGSPAAELTCRNNRISGVILSDGNYIPCGNIILATGGVSYPSTGSSGDGFKFSRDLGHKIVPLRPGLVPLIAEGNCLETLMSLSLYGVSLKIFHGDRSIKTEKGDIIFTDRGLSGPLILSVSGTISSFLEKKEKVSIGINIFPDITSEKMNDMLSEYIKNHPAKSMKHFFRGMIPCRLRDLLLFLSISPADKKAGLVTRREKFLLNSLCKDLRFSIKGTYPMREAMITMGGIHLREVDPHTMSSKIITGLYFAGEILDIAGDSGGFNLQAALSTGHLAGKSAGSAKNS